MNGHGQWPPPQQQLQQMAQQQYHQQQQQQQQQPYQQQQQPLSPGVGQGAPGNADVLPSSEQLEIEATKRGMPPLDTCLRRCPRCLQGVPIRSMMCPHCQYHIPASAKAMARRELKEALHHGGQGARSMMVNGGGGAAGGYDGYQAAQQQQHEQQGAVAAAAGGGGDAESPERPRQKRKRQSTKKGLMTATEEELAELDEGLSDDEPVSWRKTSGQRRAGRVQTDKRKKKCPSCNEMNPMSVKACRECDTVFPVGARLDSVVTSEELREKFSFEPEFNKDGTPMIEKILGRRPIKEPDPDDEDAMSVLKKHHRAAHYGHYYECLVKFKGVAYNKVEWMSDLDVRSLGMVASRMLTNYIKSKEKEEYEKGDMGSEDEEYFDPNYLEVEKVLDSKWFKMERERYPDGFDPAAFLESQDDEEGMEDDGALDEPPAERTPPPAWEDEGVAIPLQAGKRTKEDPDWRPMTRCRHVLSTLMEDDLSLVFHDPVDLDAYPSYEEKVDEPMDLGTIKGKLDHWEYRRNDPMGFLRDVRLVFTNCKVFNKFGSAIWYIADYLQAKFERLFQAWVMNFGDKDDRIPWEEPRARPWEEWCRKCVGPERKNNKMLVCDTCDAEYHLKCLRLSSVPKGQWLCPICTVMLRKGQTLFSHQTEVEKAKLSQMPQPTVEVVDELKYLIKWSGLSYQFCTWETREELNNDEAIDRFHKLNDHPPLSPPMSEEELMRTLAKNNHDVLPALLEPSSMLEYNAQIYSQIRAFHFLRCGMSPPTGLLRECGKPTSGLGESKEAAEKASVTGAASQPPSKAEEDADEIRSLLFDMKHSISHATKYEAPPRTDMAPLPMHQYEYEVTLPKEHGSLFMNIHQQDHHGIICVSVSSLCPRMPPRQREPTPVMRSRMVEVGDVITAINGQPMVGQNTSVVANALQALPACVTLRLVKYGFDFVPDVVVNQATWAREFEALLDAGTPYVDPNARRKVDESARWQDRIEAVDDEFTRSSTSGAAVGEATIEAEHRVIEELGPKRRLLMAVNESKGRPSPAEWSDVGYLYSLGDYVYAHENMGHVESIATRRHDPRAKPIEQLRAETGEVVKVWPSMTAAAAELNVGVSALSACVNGITAQAGGWKWRFASKHTATALKMGVYRKGRVADMSAGPGAYLEPEAAAAQIAAGRQGRGFDSDDEQLVFGDNAITVPPKAEAVEAAKKPPEGENGKPAAALDGAGPVDAENSASGGLKVDPNDPDAQTRFQQQGEQGGGAAAAAREQEIRRLALLASGGGEMTTYDGRPVYDNVAGGAAAAALAEGYGGAGAADLGYDGDGGYGRGGKQEADSESAGAADSDQDSDEEEGVDWDDSADEDVDAATAAAMEQARIGMARAAARELRESRATRAQMMEWPYKDGKVPDFKNTNELRDYQRRGVNWMLSCWKKKKRGCILADEMGLGKTVQVVAMLNYVFSNSERERGPFLVVVPLTTIEHWRREVEAWTDMNLCMYHDNGGRDMRDLIREYEWYYSGRSKRVLKFHVLVTTYDDVISDAEMLAQVPWRAVVVDEAHRMRNKNSALLGCLQQVVHNGMAVNAYQHRVLMTGTPMQNIKEELWPLMNFIDQSNFPDLQRFQEKYCKGEPGHEVDEARALRRRLKPYMLRRRKEDVTKDIPPKEETIIDVELTMVQKKYYRAIYERNHSVLNKVGAGAGKAPSLMNIQMELRKCCNHPFMVRGVEDHEVDQIVGNLVAEAQSGDPNKAPERLNQRVLKQLRLEKGLIHTSGKMVLLDKLLPKLRSEGHKVLIFSQFIGMLDMVQEFLSLRGHKHERLDGRTTGNERQKSIDRFNRDPNSFVFLLSTRAGGVGINLTAADTCIIYDSDWNPQNDVQAMARCHRIGQTKSVMVYRLITRDCFESEMFNRASMKLGLEQAVLGDAAGTLKPRDMEDLLKKGAYALTQMDEVDAMREFQNMDIDVILERKSRVLKEKAIAKGIADDSDQDDEEEDIQAPRGDQHRVKWRSFGPSGEKTGPSLEDPDFWRKVMPDVMTPDSMVTKLDTFEGMAEDAVTQEDKDAFMKDLGVMVMGLRKSNDDEGEREKGVQLLVRVTCKREWFSEEQCSKAKKWELELQGTRLRQAARQDTKEVEKARAKGRRGGRGAKDDVFDAKPKISATPGGSGGKSGGKGGSKGSGGRDHNMDVCARCEDGGVTMMCDGPCQRSFHPACLGMDDNPEEDPWMCNRCLNKVQKCLECGKKGSEMDSHNRAVKIPGGVSRCQLSSCGRYYHKECLDKITPNRTSYSKEGNFKCPQHFCIDCGKTSTNLGPRTLAKCLRCAKARCPDCLKTARHVKKGKWMVCSDHEWTPQDLAMFEEQQRIKKSGADKGKRKPKSPPQPAIQFTPEQEEAQLDVRAPVCYFCKRDRDDPNSVEGAFIRPPFVQRTVKHGDFPIWLHKNCMLYTPECSVEYPGEGGKGSSEGGKKSAPAKDELPSTTSSSSSSSSSSSPSFSDATSSGKIKGETSSGKGASSGDKAAAGDGGAKAKRKPPSGKPVYYGVDEARKRVGLKCTSCGKQGALIPCHVQSCSVTTHYGCARREGWKFGGLDSDGKIFLCVMHRNEGQVRFERKAPAKRGPRKSVSKTPSKGKGGTPLKGKGKGGGGSDGDNISEPGLDGDADLKSPKAKKARRSPSSAAGGGAGGVKTESGDSKRPGSGGGKGGGAKRPPVRLGEDGEPVVQCPCGVPELEPQGYVQCDSCRVWLHLECAGTTAEDVEDAGGSFCCLDCVEDASSKSPNNGGKPPQAKQRKGSLGRVGSGGGSRGGGGRDSPFSSTVAGGGGSGVKGKGKSGQDAKGGDAGGRGGPRRTSLGEAWDRLDDQLKSRCVIKALELLAKEDPLNYFAEPVDISLVPGYRDVVSNPLDFSTIKKRQKKGRYAKLGFSALWEDISTVYRNAKLYNQDESDCFIVAQKGLDSMADRLGRALAEVAQHPSNNRTAQTAKSLAGGGGKRGGGGGAGAESRGDGSEMDGDDFGDEEEEEEDSPEEEDDGSDEDFEVPASVKRGMGRQAAAAAAADAAAARDEDEDSDYYDAEEEEEGTRRGRRASPRSGSGGAAVGGGGVSDGMEEWEDSDGMPSASQLKRKRR